MDIIYGVLEQGLVYSLVGIAVLLTLRVIDFPDMGVNSTFTLGAALWLFFAKMNFNPWLGCAAAFCGGLIAGYITAALHVFFNIRSLLAGIIIMIGLYSINIRLMDAPNVPMMNIKNVFSNFEELDRIITLFLITIAALAALSWFFLSEIGLAIRVSGQNYVLGEAYGVSKAFTITTIVALSNGMVALSGALLGQLQGFVDINMGNGLIIIGLVSVIIGEKVYNTSKIYMMLIMSAVGAVLYKIAITLSLFSSDVGLRSTDMYIITALMMVSMMFQKPKT